MKPYTKALENFIGWRVLDKALLREMAEMPFGTVFVLNTLKGHAHICKLMGNLLTDKSVKAQRMTDFKYIRLERVRRQALVCILPNNVSANFYDHKSRIASYAQVTKTNMISY